MRRLTTTLLLIAVLVLVAAQPALAGIANMR
jgi:hypothetical protein